MQWEMSEKFHGEEAYTGEFVNRIAQNFVFVNFSMLQMKVPKEELDGDPAMLCKFCRGMQLC
jgi:hypothetical protein